MKIIFTEEEIAILRGDAEKARARLVSDGIHPMRIYEEEQYEFVTEYMRGADPSSSEKQQAWLKKIKKNLIRRRHENY